VTHVTLFPPPNPVPVKHWIGLLNRAFSLEMTSANVRFPETKLKRSGGEHGQVEKMACFGGRYPCRDYTIYVKKRMFVRSGCIRTGVRIFLTESCELLSEISGQDLSGKFPVRILPGTKICDMDNPAHQPGSCIDKNDGTIGCPACIHTEGILLKSREE